MIARQEKLNFGNNAGEAVCFGMENISTQSKSRQSEGPCLRFACLSAVACSLGKAQGGRAVPASHGRQCLRGPPAGQPALSPASLWASVTPFLETPFWRTRHASILLTRPARHAICSGFLKSASGACRPKRGTLRVQGAFTRLRRLARLGNKITRVLQLSHNKRDDLLAPDLQHA